jgi:hypothetical protein
MTAEARRPDEYADYEQWRDPRPAATAGDAMREFTGTPIDMLLVWSSFWKGGAEAAAQTARHLNVSPDRGGYPC